MRAQGSGLIINISGSGGFLSPPYIGGYCAVKHALEAISESLYLELAAENIDVAIMQAAPMRMDRSAPGGSPRAVEILSPGSHTLQAVEKLRQSNYTSKLEPEAVAEQIFGLIRSKRRPLRKRIGFTRMLHLAMSAVPRALIYRVVGREFSDSNLAEYKLRLQTDPN